MSTLRVRPTRNEYSGTGTYKRLRPQTGWSTTSPQGWWKTLQHDMTDYIASSAGSYPEQPCIVTEEGATPAIVQGAAVWNHVNEIVYYDDYKSHFYVGDIFTGMTTYSPNWPELVTAAVANMNPNNPIMDIPLSLFEFKDLPRMLKNAGDLLTKYGVNHKIVFDPKGRRKLYSLGASNGPYKGYSVYTPEKIRLSRKDRKRIRAGDSPEAYLAYNFGWAPLVNDLANLLNLQELLDKKYQELQDLTKGKRISRVLFNRELPGSGGTVSGGFYFHSIYNIPYTKTLYEKAWFVSQARLLSPLPPRQSAEYILQQLKIGQSDASTLWNMFPWSWLIDYFHNFGSYLQATNNKMEWEYGDITACYESKTVLRTPTQASAIIKPWYATRYPYSAYGTPQAFLSEGERWRRFFERRVYNDFSPVLAFSPMLSGKQRSILGALVVGGLLGSRSYSS